MHLFSFFQRERHQPYEKYHKLLLKLFEFAYFVSFLREKYGHFAKKMTQKVAIFDRKLVNFEKKNGQF